MAGAKKKMCYYELLGLLDRKCEPADIKSAYRKLALKLHPDKAHINGVSVEEATSKFQQVQEAYSVLSDIQERAWYDSHREQILRGDDEGGEDPFKTKINLYKYFSTACFDGFGNDSRGFFQVYVELFEAIDAEEEQWEDADEEHVSMPPFGRSDTEYSDVSAFYRRWLDFCSRKAFGHADKWNPKDADNRQVRRAMEQENKKARQAAKKDFNAEVRQLVQFVQKRDPRVAAHQKKQMKETVEKKKHETADKDRKKEEQAKEREEKKEASRLADEERWEEVRAAKEARKARGEIMSEDDGDADSDEDSDEQVGYFCEPCRKRFQSEKAFDQHAKSKKHLQVVAKLRKHLEREMEEDDDEEEDIDIEAQLEVPQTKSEPSRAGAQRKLSSENAESSEDEEKGQQQQKQQQEVKAESSDEDEDSDDDSEDDFVARFAAKQQQSASSSARGGGGRGRGRGAGGYPASGGALAPVAAEAAEAAEESDSEDSEASEDEQEVKPHLAGNAGSGKKVQKRAEQMAQLLERQREKEKVQDLVSGAKKAQREAKKGTEEEAQDRPVAATTVVGEPPEGSVCGVCKKDFESRSKLFQHIKATGHALLKPSPTESEEKGKKKKR